MLRRRFGNILEKVDSVKQTLKMTVQADEEGNWQFTENPLAELESEGSDHVLKSRKYLQDEVINHLESSLVRIKQSNEEH